jgi:Fur family ferric uptake transcriptional regulator
VGRAPDEETPHDATRESAPQRRTRQRASIQHALIEQEGFVSAQALHTSLRANGVHIGLTTVYRALAALADAGHADTMREDNGVRLFRHRPGSQHRHYLFCRECGSSEPLETGILEEWFERLGRRTGYAELRHTVEVDGICVTCGPDSSRAG